MSGPGRSRQRSDVEVASILRSALSAADAPNALISKFETAAKWIFRCEDVVTRAIETDGEVQVVRLFDPKGVVPEPEFEVRFPPNDECYLEEFQRAHRYALLSGGVFTRLAGAEPRYSIYGLSLRS